MLKTIAGTVFAARNTARQAVIASRLSEQFFAEVSVNFDGDADMVREVAFVPVIFRNLVVRGPSSARAQLQPVRSVAS